MIIIYRRDGARGAVRLASQLLSVHQGRARGERSGAGRGRRLGQRWSGGGRGGGCRWSRRGGGQGQRARVLQQRHVSGVCWRVQTSVQLGPSVGVGQSSRRGRCCGLIEGWRRWRWCRGLPLLTRHIGQWPDSRLGWRRRATRWGTRGEMLIRRMDRPLIGLRWLWPAVGARFRPFGLCTLS